MTHPANSDPFKTFETAWCPGCGNFVILNCLKKALTQLGLDPHEVLMVAGIGQAAKIPQYIETNGFCGLHGRALPVAAAAKMANDRLTVIVSTGDGDSFGEGGNHFLHNVRRNINLAHFVHDNQIYGLTKGQASPTSTRGHITPVQVFGSLNEPLNPVLLALALGAGFVARGFTGNPEQLTDLMKTAIQYRGYALLDIIQPCVSFNKINTLQRDREQVFDLPADHDPTNLDDAMRQGRVMGDKLPLGIFYNVSKPTFHDLHPVLDNPQPLVRRSRNLSALQALLDQLSVGQRKSDQ